MPFTPEQEKLIQQCVIDFYQEFPELQSTVAKQTEEIEELKQRVTDLETWKENLRKALRLRKAQETSAI